jgi:hypothetical protein
VGAHVNERMAELGLEGRIDHRSYEEQGIELEPQHKIGPAASRRPERGEDAERIEDHRASRGERRSDYRQSQSRWTPSPGRPRSPPAILAMFAFGIRTARSSSTR